MAWESTTSNPSPRIPAVRRPRVARILARLSSNHARSPMAAVAAAVARLSQLYEVPLIMGSATPRLFEWVDERVKKLFIKRTLPAPSVELLSTVVPVFSLMAGFDPLDSTTVDRPVPEIQFSSSLQKSLDSIRIGVPEEYFIQGIQPAVEEHVQKAIQTFQSLGAEIIPISMPHTEYALPVYYLIAPAEASANLARYDGLRYGPRVSADDIWGIVEKTRGERFGAEVKRRIMLGTYALSAGYYDEYYGQAQKVRTLIKQDFDKAFTQVDIIAAPVAPTTAFPIGAHSNDPVSMYLEDIFTLPANLAGVPGVAFPVGFDEKGLPIGMQLMGSQFSEALLLQVTDAYQTATDWHTRFPEM